MPRFTEDEAREAIAASQSWAESLRRLGYCHTGSNPATLKKWAARWNISTDHFDPAAASNEALRRHNKKIPLDEILVEGSTYSRSNLKRRLYETGLKRPECELCGQGAVWRGKRMALISITSTGSEMTTGSRTCESRAQIAPPRWKHTAE